MFKGSNMPGDLSVTWVHPGAILAWHRHEHQDDWMLVVQGALRVGRWQGTASAAFRVEWHTLTHLAPQPLVVEAGWWHGYQNIGSEPALLLTYITEAYSADDEFRMPVSEAPLTWERSPR